LIFTGLWFGIYIRLTFRKYKIIMSWKKTKFEDLKELLLSFRVYFVIVEDIVCIFIMYYLLL
jgi:hypothetical protein